MRVKCANCGMIYEDTPECISYSGVLIVGDIPKLKCPGCKSNAKDWVEQPYKYSSTVTKAEK